MSRKPLFVKGFVFLLATILLIGGGFVVGDATGDGTRDELHDRELHYAVVIPDTTAPLEANSPSELPLGNELSVESILDSVYTSYGIMMAS